MVDKNDPRRYGWSVRTRERVHVTTETTIETGGVYATENSPQKREHTLAIGRAYVARRHAKARLACTDRPSRTVNDPAVVNVPMAGSRAATLERDIERGVKLQRREADVEQAQRRVEFLEKNQPESFTREDLEGACEVVDKDGTAYGIVRVNRKTVTASWAGYDIYRWSFDKIYRLIPKSR
jgi:hypothetical protein